MSRRLPVILCLCFCMLASESTGQAGQPWDVSQATRLPAGLTQEQARFELSGSMPGNISLVDLVISGDTVIAEFSPEISNNLDEAKLRDIFDYLRAAFFDYRQIRCIRLVCNGKPLWSYLEPVLPTNTKVDKGVAKSTLLTEGLTLTQGLSGKNITIGPSHGRVWHSIDEYWYWQRGENCGAGEELMEGLLSIRLMQLLYQYLSQDSAVVHVCRQLDKSDCCHPAENMPWWKMASRYWLEHLGVPTWVWDSSTTDINDDIRARPLYADYQGSDIYFSHHTNAFNGTATGTVTFRDTEMEHPQHEADSYNLALSIQNNVISAIQSTYDAGWYDRGVKDSTGDYGEIRIPNRPACLIELAFHDNCTLDGVYLRDPFFCSLSEWAIYKGICEYFGRTPTWDMYSCEYVSDTIPAQMLGDEIRSVGITFRNRGVLWSNERDFKLGAVDNSDPFAATRHLISGEVGPGDTYTFNFTMTAPSVEGSYISDWQMIREPDTWFGPAVVKSIHVWPSPIPGDFDGDLDVDHEDFGVIQHCLTGPAAGPPAAGCEITNLDRDSDVDQDDVIIFLGCMTGPNIPGDAACDD
ncbi:MAG: N-acetylmuramoyl-L-alanine amidase [Planctomycetota bacterium]